MCVDNIDVHLSIKKTYVPQLCDIDELYLMIVRVWKGLAPLLRQTGNLISLFSI